MSRKIDNTRWRVVIYYRTYNGLVDVEHRIREIRQLHDIVERGPSWDTIEEIKIFRVNHVESPTLTIEDAEKL